MVKLILYLLECSALLGVFYLLYGLILKRETFFSLNRFFLIGSLVVSLLIPLLSFDINPSSIQAVQRRLMKSEKLGWPIMTHSTSGHLTILQPPL